MISMHYNKYEASGAIVENFIVEIFQNVCKGTIYKLKRQEYQGGPPAPGTFIHPTFEIINTYTERVIASYSGTGGGYCNEKDFFPYYKQINEKLKLAIEDRVEEWEKSEKI